MFKLYVDDCGWEKIGETPSEAEMVSTMIGYTNTFNVYRFVVIYHDEKMNCDIPYKSITNEDNFKKYLLDCKERNIKLVSKKKKKVKQKNLNRKK